MQKTSVRLVLASVILVLLACPASAQTEGTTTIRFTTVSAGGNFAPRHVLAVWVQDASNAFVRTLLRRAQKRQQYLYTWNKTSGGNSIDAVTGATLTSHQTHTVTWDGRDASAELVPDGIYRLRVEFTSEHAQGPITPVTYLEFTKGTESVNSTPADLPYFKNISLSYAPDVETHTLIPALDTWMYNDGGVDLHATDWKLASYDDSAWKQGKAILGYGDPVATTLDYGPNPDNKYPCYYFRHTLQMTFVPESLKIRVLRDDGVVVYINGTEAARDSMDPGPTSYADLASTTASGDEETTYHTFTADGSLLVPGTNAIAVEVHQASAGSSDLGFDLELKSTPPAEGPVVFLRGDSDGNGELQLTDAIFTLQFLFLSGPISGCLAAADTNDDDSIDVSDAVRLLLFLFKAGDAPPAPYPDCGEDPDADSLSCITQPTCP